MYLEHRSDSNLAPCSHLVLNIPLSKLYTSSFLSMLNSGLNDQSQLSESATKVSHHKPKMHMVFY